ncbi:winged helix-turn-helix domain-containing protein [Nisaea sediminum]|uniref:winged helix-turn-helix domain-containing protein n=1 Tax=Nisaea sediminum TaxID=2775867 RepID=UPI0018682C90|nr:crosslink repair DNA glycosylase YcaQ family protein [Nisaea sediminum]
MTDQLPNRDARRLFLHLHALGDSPGRPFRRKDVPELIHRIGFVQVDSIRTVERAHHHILFSRANAYKPDWLHHHLERERTLFENWTHDASVIPVEFFRYWKPKFHRTRERLMRFDWWRERLGEDYEETCARIRAHIEENGPVRSRDLTADESHHDGSDENKAWWGWKPSKSALEHLWRTGQLAVSAREGFQKVYDLVEKVVPPEHYEPEVHDEEFIDWACRSALERLGFATPGELAAYWDAITPAEAKDWAERQGPETAIPVDIGNADGTVRRHLARPDALDLAGEVPPPPGRVRFLSPFDPALRDRKRLQRLFGYDYRIEVFVPEEKRQYGYYVFPMLEGDKLTGRIDMKADRPAGALRIRKLWLEPRLTLTPQRKAKIEAELQRWLKYLGLERAEGDGFEVAL